MQVWERQPQETARQYEYFSFYRDSGALRSLEKVQEEYSKSESLIAKISSKNNWVARVDAYDRYIDEIKRKQNIEAIKKANEVNINIAQSIKFVGGAKVQAVAKRIQQAKGDPEAIAEIAQEVPWGVLSSLLNTAITVEKQAYGVSDEDLTLTVKSNGIDKINIEIKKKEMLSKLGVADVGMPEEPNLNS